MAAPRSIPPKDTVVEETTVVTTVDTPPTEKRSFVSEGETYEVEVGYFEGRAVLAKSIYKSVPLPGTTKTTQILVAAAGTSIQGY